MCTNIEQFAQNEIAILDQASETIKDQVRHAHIITKDMLPNKENISILVHSPMANFLSQNQNFHRHDFFELVYVYKGQATQYNKAGQLTLDSGSILLMNTNYWHGISIASNEDIVFNILISPDVLKTAFINLVSGNDLFYKFFIDDLFQNEKAGDYILCQANECPAAINMLDSLLGEWIEKKDCYQSACTAYLSLVFTEIFRSHVVQELGSNKAMMEDILRNIEDNLDSVTLSDLADKYHYSNEHMSRVIKSMFGKNFTVLLRDLRLEQAVYLMKNSSQSVDSIALQLGYYDRSHFNKVFKKKFGVSPNEYLNGLT